MKEALTIFLGAPVFAAAAAIACDLQDPGLLNRDAGPDVNDAHGGMAATGAGGTISGAGGGEKTMGGSSAARGGADSGGSMTVDAQVGVGAMSGRDPDAGRDRSVVDAMVLDAGRPDACSLEGVRCGDASRCDTHIDADPLNCGACDHDCHGGACSNGVCQPVQLAGRQTVNGFPKGLAVNATHVYWTTVLLSGSTFAGVFACPLSGCGSNPAGLFSMGRNPVSVAATADTVFASDFDRATFCPVSGCGAGAMTCAASQNNPGEMTTDGAAVYWVDWGTDAKSGSDGQIVKGTPSSASTCDVADLADAQYRPSALAVDGGTLYWIVEPSSALTVDGKIMSCSTSGCNKMPATVISGALRPTWIAARAGALYWSSDSTTASDGSCAADGAIHFCANCKGVDRSILQNLQCPQHIAVDGQWLYWLERLGTYTSRIYRSRLDGTEKEPFTEDRPNIQNLVVDDENVYWLELDGSVWRKAK